jgi:hypothetical protein
MQREKTLQFWDDFYTQHQMSVNAESADQSKEWVLYPSLELLAQITQQMPLDRDITILEIGCGTSTLARELYLYLQLLPNTAYYSSQQSTASASALTVSVEKAHFHDCARSSASPVYKRRVIATDVSPVCISQMRERDARIIQSSQGDFSYEVLNIADNDHPHLARQFDVILDKGCLDTFLFRSRQRGSGQVYADLVRRVLNHLHSWLRDEPMGRYLILTPRSKLHSIRDFAGFTSVQRRPLTDIHRADLEGDEKGNEDNKSSTDKDIGSNTVEEAMYFYTCCKNSSYSADDPAFRIPIEKDPQDEDMCPGCLVTFYDFRKGEDVRGRGRPFWFREWRGHCRHCKGPDSLVLKSKVKV